MDFQEMPEFLKNNCSIWEYFNQIRQIPRKSKQEEQIRNYIINLAKSKNLPYKIDKIGNLIIYRKSNSENTICLQSHLDMVCQKNEDTNHDFDKDIIKLKKENNFLKAEGTTLGADNGIGVAYMLTLMMDDSKEYPNLELLFTIDE